MGVPWETVIKIYRDNLMEKEFDYVEEYANDFLQFIEKSIDLFPEEHRRKHFGSLVYAFLDFLREELISNLDTKFKEGFKLSSNEIGNLLNEELEKMHKMSIESNVFSCFPEDFKNTLLEVYSDVLDSVITEVFEKIPLDNAMHNKLKETVTFAMLNYPIETSNLHSGIVIAGFGNKEVFPSLVNYNLEGIFADRLKFEKKAESKIDFTTSSYVGSFAQNEMVSTFMEGIHPRIREDIESDISEILKEIPELFVDVILNSNEEEKKRIKEVLSKALSEMIADYEKKLQGYLRENFVDPTVNIIMGLPKDELAALAESLINLQSLKKKMSMEAETVGGPIDVAVISKGDGFVWIKRKHYFDPKLNPRYFRLKY